MGRTETSIDFGLDLLGFPYENLEVRMGLLESGVRVEDELTGVMSFLGQLLEGRWKGGPRDGPDTGGRRGGLAEVETDLFEGWGDGLGERHACQVQEGSRKGRSVGAAGELDGWGAEETWRRAQAEGRERSCERATEAHGNPPLPFLFRPTSAR